MIVKLLICALAILNCLMFTFAFIFYFKTNSSEPNGLLSLLKVVGLITTISTVFYSTKLMILEVVPLFFLIVSFAIFFSAYLASRNRGLGVAFTSNKPHWLIDWGIYRYVRHPFYSSYSLTWIAIALASGSAIQCSLTLLMLALYYTAAKGEENFFNETEFADSYKSYSRRTGMFIPRIRSFAFFTEKNSER